jgi:hypothetical protein
LLCSNALGRPSTACKSLPYISTTVKSFRHPSGQLQSQELIQYFKRRAAYESRQTEQSRSQSPVIRSSKLLAIVIACLFAFGCSVNRRVVRVQTQLQMIHNDLARRESRRIREFELMTRIMRQHSLSLETNAKKVEEMQRELSHSKRLERFDQLERQITRLRKSAQEATNIEDALDTDVAKMSESLQDRAHSGLLNPAFIVKRGIGSPAEPESRPE